MKILAALMFFLVSLSSFAAEPTAMKLYDGSKYRYSIQYPSDWNVYDRDDGVVVAPPQLEGHLAADRRRQFDAHPLLREVFAALFGK